MSTAILVTYLVIVALRVGLELLNLRHRREQGGRIPDELANFVDPETHAKSSRYAFDKARFGLFRMLLSAVIVVAFLFAGGLAAYDKWVGELISTGLWRGVGFFIGLHAASSLLEVPLDAYSTLRIEQKHGFNRMTLGLFLADWAKGLLLSMVLLVVVSVAGLTLLRISPEWYWFWVWCFAIALTVLLMLIAPTVIEPLFIKTEPLGNSGLSEAVQQLAQRVGVRVTQVLKMDASRRTSHSNAYFTGIGSTKRVVLFDTLLDRLTENEILAVLGHELGHWKLRHVSSRLLSTAGFAGLGLFAASRALAWPGFSEWFGMKDASIPAQVILLGFLGSLLGFVLTPISAFWSRRHEWQADNFARSTTGLPSELGSALAKLARDNLSNLHPHPWYAAFYHSHPPTVQRIRMLQTESTT